MVAGLLGLLWLLLYVLVMSWSAGVLVRAATLPRGIDPGAHCAVCRYPWPGGAVCPECGAKVQVEGLISRRMIVRRRGERWIAAFVVFTLGLGVLVQWSVMMLTIKSSMPQTTIRSTCTFDVESSRGPSRGSDALPLFGLNMIVDGIVAPPKALQKGKVTLEVTSAAVRNSSLPVVTGSKLVVDVPVQTWELIDDSGVEIDRGIRFDRGAVEKLFLKAGLSLTRPGIPETAEHVAGLMSSSVSDAFSFSMAEIYAATDKAAAGTAVLHSRGSTSRPGFTTPVVTLFGLKGYDSIYAVIGSIGAVALAGMVGVIVWRRRVLLRM